MYSNVIVNKICGIYQARKERHFPTCSFLVVRLKLEKECTHTCTCIHAWATVCQSQHEVKTITVYNYRRRERRAAESSEERETRLAKRRMADRARYAANQTRKTERPLLNALSRGRRD